MKTRNRRAVCFVVLSFVPEAAFGLTPRFAARFQRMTFLEEDRRPIGFLFAR